MKQVSPFVCRFAEITPEWVNREMHLHTNWTDGEPAVLDVIRRCEELGLGMIAFTEHVRADSAWFNRFADEIAVGRQGSAVKVLVAVEAAVIDPSGRLNLSPEIRSRCELVLGSVHRFPGPDGKPVPFASIDRSEFARREFDLALAIMERGEADVLAHPGGMSVRHAGGFPEEYLLALMQRSEPTGVAIEINCSYITDLPRFLELARQTNPWISMGSDAHQLRALGACRDRMRAALWNV